MFEFSSELEAILEEGCTTKKEESKEDVDIFSFDDVETESKKEESKEEVDIFSFDDVETESKKEESKEEVDIWEETSPNTGYTGMPTIEQRNEDKYINAINAFTEYMPLNLSIDRYLPAAFESLIDNESSLPTIVIEKLESNMITMVHNLSRRPVPAMLNENRQPVIKWDATLYEFIERLEDEVTLRHGLDQEEFKSMKKIIILENMSEKVDLNQNEVYITRQDAVDLLLNKYDSIIDLTENNCSINFKESNKKYSLNIGGLGYNDNLNSSWTEEIKYKIEFLRPRQILLTGMAASNKIVTILKDEYQFNIANEATLKSLAMEI